MTPLAGQRRDHVLRSAAKCFADQGFHQTSVADICAAASMSPGSLYRYFRSKGEIIRAMIELEQHESAAIVESLRNAPDLVEGLQRCFATTTESFGEPGVNAMHAEVTAEALRNPDAAASLRAGDEATLTQLGDVLRQAQSRGEIDPSLDPGATAEVITALLDGLWWRQAMRPSAPVGRHTPTVNALLQRFLRTALESGPSSLPSRGKS